MVISPELRPELRPGSFAIYCANVQMAETLRQRVGAYGAQGRARWAATRGPDPGVDGVDGRGAAALDG
jgi:hypothetical protein